jgi:rRNA maturation endonuclease Nob1
MAGIEKQKGVQMKKIDLKICPHCGGQKLRMMTMEFPYLTLAS